MDNSSGLDHRVSVLEDKMTRIEDSTHELNTNVALLVQKLDTYIERLEQHQEHNDVCQRREERLRQLETADGVKATKTLGTIVDIVLRAVTVAVLGILAAYVLAGGKV